eukprot:scaffold2114_cov253-Pinguiococcus_pyrenoidosus.AAC.24
MFLTERHVHSNYGVGATASTVVPRALYLAVCPHPPSPLSFKSNLCPRSVCPSARPFSWSVLPTSFAWSVLLNLGRTPTYAGPQLVCTRDF